MNIFFIPIISELLLLLTFNVLSPYFLIFPNLYILPLSNKNEMTACHITRIKTNTLPKNPPQLLYHFLFGILYYWILF